MFGQKHAASLRWLPPLLLLLLSLSCQFPRTNSLIVPQELPSLLSVIYSNIPPIKKGTDSRLGFGFRLGDHADFQVILELGPQKNTQPIGDQDKEDQSFNKRQISKAEQRAILRQQIMQRQQEQANELTSTERSAATWLQSWSSAQQEQPIVAKKMKKAASSKAAHTGDLDLSMFPPPPLMRVEAMTQLQQLYKMATSSSTTTTTPSTPPPFKSLPLNLGGPRPFTLPPPALSQDTNTLNFVNPRSKNEITKELMDVSLEDGA